jgi:hypothetical protein
MRNEPSNILKNNKTSAKRRCLAAARATGAAPSSQPAVRRSLASSPTCLHHPPQPRAEAVERARLARSRPLLRNRSASAPEVSGQEDCVDREGRLSSRPESSTACTQAALAPLRGPVARGRGTAGSRGCGARLGVSQASCGPSSPPRPRRGRRQSSAHRGDRGSAGRRTGPDRPWPRPRGRRVAEMARWLDAPWHSRPRLERRSGRGSRMDRPAHH